MKSPRRQRTYFLTRMFRREAGPLALLGPAICKHLILPLLRAIVKISAVLLLAELQFFRDGLITVEIFVMQIIEQTPALPDHH